MANPSAIFGNTYNETGDLVSVDLVTGLQISFVPNNFTLYYNDESNAGTDASRAAFNTGVAADGNIAIPGMLGNTVVSTTTVIPTYGGTATLWNRTQNGGVINIINPKTLAVVSTYNITAAINNAAPLNSIPIEHSSLHGYLFGLATMSQSDGTTATITGGNNFQSGDVITVGLTGATWLTGGTVSSASPTNFSFNDTSGHGAFGPMADSGSASASTKPLLSLFTMQWKSTGGGLLGVTYGIYDSGSPVYLLSGFPTPSVVELDFDQSLWTAGNGGGIAVGDNGQDASTVTFDQDGLTGWAFEDFGPGFAHFNLSPTNFTLSSVAASVGTTAVYSGTIGGATNAYAGYYFTVTGFTNTGNNISYAALCTASTSVSLTLTNSAATVESASATATYYITHQDAFFGDPSSFQNSVFLFDAATFIQDDNSHYYVMWPGSPAPFNPTLYKSHLGTGSSLWNNYMADDATLDLSSFLPSFASIENWSAPIKVASDGSRYLIFTQDDDGSKYGSAICVNVDTMVYNGFVTVAGTFPFSSPSTAKLDASGDFWINASGAAANATANFISASGTQLTVTFTNPTTAFNPMNFLAGETVVISVSGSNVTLDAAVNAQKYFTVVSATATQLIVDFTYGSSDTDTLSSGHAESNSVALFKWHPADGYALNSSSSPVSPAILTATNSAYPGAGGTVGGVTYSTTQTTDYTVTGAIGGNEYAGTYVYVKGVGIFLCVVSTSTILTVANPAGSSGYTGTVAVGNLFTTDHRVFASVLGTNNGMGAMALAPATSSPSGTRAFHPNALSFGW